MIDGNHLSMLSYSSTIEEDPHSYTEVHIYQNYIIDGTRQANKGGLLFAPKTG